MQRLCPALVLAIFTSCAVHHNPPKTTVKRELPGKQQIQQWIETKEFGKATYALAAIEADDPDSPQIAELRNDLQKKIEDYEQSVLQKTRKLLSQERQNDALECYSEALARLPKGTELKDQFATLHNLQISRTEELQTKIAKIRAEALVNSIPVYKQLVTLNPHDDNFRTHALKLRNEGSELAAKLAENARLQVQTGDMRNAVGLIELAEQLSEDPAIRSIAEDIRSQSRLLAKSRPKPGRSTPPKPKHDQPDEHDQPEEETALNLSLTRFDHLLQNHDYTGAAEILETIGNAKNHGEEIATRERRLERAVRQKVEHLYTQGVKYYSQENYSLALQSWSEVLRLQPDHAKAREYSKRATRIVQKIEQLRKKQAVP
ncbi:MAG: hypothetical protein ACU843_09405 [Gammaproteobacteria bacterium]